MSSTRQTILQALREIRLIDPHSHINPHQPASTTLADLLGYHYYTELVHSAGTPKAEIESTGLEPRELVRRLVKGLPNLTNTAQYAWLIDICQRFYGFEGDTLDESNWESLYDSAEETMKIADWADVVLEKSNVEAVFLTNDFDEDLKGFDTNTYIPCLRTDDLVFHLSKPDVRDRLAICSGIDIDGSLKSIRHSLEQRFEHFVSRGARACAISLPPDFSPAPVSDGRASTALEAILRSGPAADTSHRMAIAKRVFWTIVELCDQFKLPMDLMIGVNRGVYGEGVHQGRDLYDSRVSLIQYRELLNAFPDVKFPISVLASVTNQELVSYAWIFPNVITNGHWWYSNTPSFIRRDAAARLEAVPRNNQIGYYSDAYKLEFIAPKFDMYRRILAGILMDDFVIERGWSEERAIELGRQVLRGNVDTIFPERTASTAVDIAEQESWAGSLPSGFAAPAAAAAGLMSSDIGMDLMQSTEPADDVQVDEDVQVDYRSQLVEEEPQVPERLATIVDDDLSDSTIVDWTDDVNASPQTPDPLSTLESDPEFDIESESSDSASVHEPETNEIHYFRADDLEPTEIGFGEPDGGENNDERDESIGLFADPTTGELTWPTNAVDEISHEPLEETYLLPEESNPVLAEASIEASVETPAENSPEDLEILDFEELEFTDIEDDSELLVSSQDSSDELSLFDPDQKLEFESDEEPKD